MTEKHIAAKKAKLWIHEEGFCMIEFLPGVKVGAQDMRDIINAEDELIGLAKELGRTQYLIDGQIPFVCVDIRAVMGVTQAARKMAVQIRRDNTIGGVALVANSAIGRVIGNSVINYNRPQFLVRLFGDREDALKWLRSLKK